MTFRKMSFKNSVPVIVLAFAVILSASSLIAPWWTIKTPVSNRINTNITDEVYYNPFQTISANHGEPDVNNTFSITVPFGELGVNNTDIGGLSSLFSTTYYIAVLGLIFTALALVSILVSFMSSRAGFLFGFSWILGLIGTILQLLASLYLVSQGPVALGNLLTVTPPQIAMMPGSGITSFWGSSSTWIWAAGIGWIFMLTAGLLCGTAVILIRAAKKG